MMGAYQMVSVTPASNFVILPVALNGALVNLFPLSEKGKNKKKLRTSLVWAIMQHVVIILYGRFGTTYRFHLHGSRI
jgi:hypothetical protein